MRLSDIYQIGKQANCIEDDFMDVSMIIDKGFNFEAYGNPDGADSASSDGASLFMAIDCEVTLNDLLNVTAHLGSIKDATLTVRIVGSEERPELSLCAENPISGMLAQA